MNSKICPTRVGCTNSLLRTGSLSRKHGFSMVELLSVIGVIAILAAILISVTMRIGEKASAAQCVSNLRQIGVAQQLYAAENNGQIPAPSVPQGSDYVIWHRSLGRGEGLPDALFSCPVQLNLHDMDAGTQTYGMNGRIGHGSKLANGQDGVQSVLELVEPSATLFLMDGYRAPGNAWFNAAVFPQASRPGPVHGDGINCLFFDGRVEQLSEAQIPRTATDPRDRLFWQGK